MYINEKCPCENDCCAGGTCAMCANEALEAMDEGSCCGGSEVGGGAEMVHPLSSPVFKFVGVFLIIFLITLIANNIKTFKRIGMADRQQNAITIEGLGKVTAAPNIAVTSVGLVTEKSDVAAAQLENSKKMNALVASLKKLGIADEDIKTAQYQIYPKYSYEEKKGSSITGYSVSQSLDVKIRDLTKISEVLAAAGGAGANQVSGIQFTIDEPKNLHAEARAEAVKDAQDKAEKLANDLGIRLGRVIGFSESQGGSPVPYPMMAKDAVGGYAEAAPQIQAGTLDIQSNVSVTYEIR